MKKEKLKFEIVNLYTLFLRESEMLEKELSKETMDSILTLLLREYCYPKNYNKRTGKYNNKNYETFRVNSDILKSLTHNYNSYIIYLIDKGILIRDNQYEVGKYSKGFIFTNYFKYEANIRIQFIKVTRFPELEFRPPSNVMFKIDDITVEHLKNDYEQLVYCGDGYPEKEITGHFINDNTGEEETIVNFRNYLFDIIRLKEIHTGHKWMKWSSITDDDNWMELFDERPFNLKQEHGRCYTNFTQISSETKKLFNFGDGQLLEIDIPNSFPMFLILYLIKNCGLLNMELNDNEQGILYSIKVGKFWTGTKYSTGLKQLFDKHRNDNISTHNKNKPYEEWYERPFYSKDEVKKYFMYWLNGTNEDNFVSDVFDIELPNIHYLMLQNKISPDYFFVKLAQLESEYMHNTLITKLYKDIPNIRIITCHDAIYYEREFDDQVHILWAEMINELRNDIPDYDLTYEPEENDELMEMFDEHKHGRKWDTTPFKSNIRFKDELDTIDDWIDKKFNN